jgi:hypothetical protein
MAKSQVAGLAHGELSEQQLEEFGYSWMEKGAKLGDDECALMVAERFEQALFARVPRIAYFARMEIEAALSAFDLASRNSSASRAGGAGGAAASPAAGGGASAASSSARPQELDKLVEAQYVANDALCPSRCVSFACAPWLSGCSRCFSCFFSPQNQGGVCGRFYLMRCAGTCSNQACLRVLDDRCPAIYSAARYRPLASGASRSVKLRAR